MKFENVELCPVLITLKSRQRNEEGEERSELLTVGTSEWEDGTFVLRYEETDATGFAGSLTSIEISPEQLMLILREGEVSSNLTMEENRKHFGLYRTPFGDVTIGIQTSLLRFRPEPDGTGSLQAEYVVDLNGVFLSRDRLELSWEPTDDSPDRYKDSDGKELE